MSLSKQTIHVNATLTTDGTSPLAIFPTKKEISLLVNVLAAPTGSTPVLVFTIQELDPGDGVTVISSIAGSGITAIGTQRITLNIAYGGLIQVIWTIAGTLPSFTRVYATLLAAEVIPLPAGASTDAGLAALAPLTNTQLRASAIPTSAAALELAQAANAANATGPMVQGVVSDTPPTSFIDGEIRPVSLTAEGRVRVSVVSANLYIDFFGDTTPIETEMIEFFNKSNPWAT